MKHVSKWHVIGVKFNLKRPFLPQNQVSNSKRWQIILRIRFFELLLHDVLCSKDNKYIDETAKNI